MPKNPTNIKTVKESLDKIEKTLRENPDLLERTSDYFAGRLKGEPLTEQEKTKDNRKAVNLRVDQEILERAEQLIPKIKADPELSALGRISTSSVIRLAILKGLEILEKKF
jgi:hypothetical protein